MRKPDQAVFVVEDEPLMLMAIVDDPEDAGFTVCRAGNTREATLLLDSLPTSAVLRRASSGTRELVR